MPDISNAENDFLTQVTATVEKNMANEQFGVSELADAMNMSRSNLLRRVKKVSNLSVSQLISQIRLKAGFNLLKTSSLNVSEVSHQVGFNSPSYFIKCFREHYGYPPGEIGKHDISEAETITVIKTNRLLIPVIIGVMIVVVALGGYYMLRPTSPPVVEKSIAVLPFKNESNDSTNVYLINGLMESTLNNLQKINDLRVISRTSSEKYRNTSKSIPEMAQELNVEYFVEGSGQKIGSKIVLNIQLIEAATDKHLWSKQYRREAKDIFELQEEVARNIAEEIEVVITPEIAQSIRQKPTNDLIAYDYYLKGRDIFLRKGNFDLDNSLLWFRKAIDQDPNFGRAYAAAAMVYYYLDVFQVDKKYTQEINAFSDKAMLLDPDSEEALIAKGLSFTHRKEFKQAVPYFDKALKINSHSLLALHFLTEFYTIHDPNPRKYLGYAIRKAKLNEAGTDSATLAFTYFQLGNAFMQCGLLEEASKYIHLSLDYDPNGYFTRYVAVYIDFSISDDVTELKKQMLREAERDPTRFDIIQEMGKICYMMRDYKAAYGYYRKFDSLRTAYNLDLFRSEDLRLAVVYKKMGLLAESERFEKSYLKWADTDQTIYRDVHPAMYYGYKGDIKKALGYLRKFSEKDNFIYWVVLMKDDPETDPLRSSPEFYEIMKTIERKVAATRDEIREELRGSGFLVEK